MAAALPMGKVGLEPTVFLCDGFTVRCNRRYAYLPKLCGFSPERYKPKLQVSHPEIFRSMDAGTAR